MKITKSFERWSPFVLLAIILVLWQLLVMLFRVPDFIFPSPWQIGQQFFEFSGPLLEAAWKIVLLPVRGRPTRAICGRRAPRSRVRGSGTRAPIGAHASITSPARQIASSKAA